MNTPAELTQEPPLGDVEVTTSDVEQVERALIDASTRLPVLFFYTRRLSGSARHAARRPHFVQTSRARFARELSFLTWGRIRPAHMNVMVYGWASMAGIGTAIWLMARCAAPPCGIRLLLIAAAAFWNLGVLLGSAEFLPATAPVTNGSSFRPTPSSSFSSPTRSSMSWAMLMFRFRRGGHIYITQWYLLGAFLWFPWLYGADAIMLFVVPVQGVMQAAVTWWFANNLSFSGSARSGSARPIT
jgi:cytochrome c oxidase cbb3-type subunit 1